MLKIGLGLEWYLGFPVNTEEVSGRNISYNWLFVLRL